MATTIFDRLMSFKDWFTRTNTLGTDVGDTTSLNVELGSNIINGTVVVSTKLGDTSTLVSGDDKLVDSMNNVANEIGRFRINEGEPQAYDMHPIAVFGTETDFDAHGMVE
jgi:hypothetical protein